MDDGAHAPVGCCLRFGSDLENQLGHAITLNCAGPAAAHIVVEGPSMLYGKAFRQLPILAVAKPLQLACGLIRHIVGTLHQGLAAILPDWPLGPRK
jgi:hypothetical protein